MYSFVTLSILSSRCVIHDAQSTFPVFNPLRTVLILWTLDDLPVFLPSGISQAAAIAVNHTKGVKNILVKAKNVSKNRYLLTSSR